MEVAAEEPASRGWLQGKAREGWVRGRALRGVGKGLKWAKMEGAEADGLLTAGEGGFCSGLGWDKARGSSPTEAAP